MLLCVAMALNHLQNTMGHFGLRLPTPSPDTSEPSNHWLVDTAYTMTPVHTYQHLIKLVDCNFKNSRSSSIYRDIQPKNKKFHPNCQYALGVTMNMLWNYDILIRSSLQRSLVSRDRQKSTANITRCLIIIDYFFFLKRKNNLKSEGIITKPFLTHTVKAV